VVNVAIDGHTVDPERVQAEGPAVDVSPKQAPALGLIVHELETNAAKHRALSNDTGRVEICWTFEDERTLCLSWREFGRPPATPPQHEGFGSTLISQLTDYGLSGTADIAYHPEGLQCRIVIRLAKGETERPGMKP
jgi:diguanylate cyclase